jgi:hypothetical protein
VSLILTSSFPLNLIWGLGAVQIWNQAYVDICGEKHPTMFGSDYRDCWASAWPAIGRAFDEARAGHTSFLEDQPMLLDRNGFLEETWFTFSLSPIRDERRDIAGLFHPVTETSARMLTKRRARVARLDWSGGETRRSTVQLRCLRRRPSTFRSRWCTSATRSSAARACDRFGTRLRRQPKSGQTKSGGRIRTCDLRVMSSEKGL